MTSFAQAASSQETTTTNGMKAYTSTGTKNVDLFFKIAASRNNDTVLQDFAAAYGEDREMALRILQWARDVRGGAGERKVYRDILKYLVNTNIEDASILIKKTPELGRWDDIFEFVGKTPANDLVVSMIRKGLEDKDALLAKWLPREKGTKSAQAALIRKALGLTPKEYRKTIVQLTNVVETQMCAKNWDAINFSHVPSVAASRYRSAFKKNAGTAFETYVQSLVSGDPEVKVNAGVVFPHDVLKNALPYRPPVSQTEREFIKAQWEAMVNNVGGANVLPMVDVSGSMTCPVGGNPNLRCIDVAVSLGLYFADKNLGPFKDVFCTFSGSPQLEVLKGDIFKKIDQMARADWGMSTNLERAFDLILKTAVNGSVAQEEMPKVIVILSDMQFNSAISFDSDAHTMIREKFARHGYQVPSVVFWNLNAKNNTPVRSNAAGVSLVSGFNTSIMKAFLEGNTDDMTPTGVMLKAVMNDRYAV